MNPITREEKLLDGQNIVPETRKEKFIKRIYDKTQPVPEPITREEWFLNKAAEGSGGDVTIEQLNVTQNGTYSEQGKAYSPVIVEVPEPVLTTKNITSNGTYLASEDNADGYSSVEVSVAPPENSFILNAKKDDVVDISDAADFDIAGLKVDVTSSDEVLVGVGNGTEFVGNNTPYLFRETPHNVGNRVYEDAIVGGSVAWNQLVQNGDFESTTGWVYNGVNLSVGNNKAIATRTDVGSGSSIHRQNINYLANHKYLVSVTVTPSANTTKTRVRIYGDSDHATFGSNNAIASNTRKTISEIINPNFSSASGRIYLYFDSDGGTVGDTYDVENFMLTDLTLMFGSTIANYVYTLETSEAGSGIAWLKANGYFLKDYYPYNAGGIQSVKTSAKKVVGFNAYNNATGKAHLVGGHEYQITGAYTALSYSTGETLTPDANGKFTPTDNGELTVTGGNGTTTCVHLVWDGERDGEYEPYEEHTYPLDSDLELRGIPKLVDGKIKYDGDLYASDGTVTRRYGIVDLGTLNWSYESDSYFRSSAPEGSAPPVSGGTTNIVQTKYSVFTGTLADFKLTDKTIYYGATNVVSGSSRVAIRDTAYSDAATFKTAMNGVYLVYPLATPTTESADPYISPQWISNWGTEEFVDTRDVPVPVGHESKYFDGEIYHSYIYDSNNERIAVTGTADLLTGEVTGGNHCDTFVIKPTGDNVVVETGEVEVKYLAPLEAI